MADGELVVWLNGVKVATIIRERSRLRMEYTTEALERYELGVPILSFSLPLTNERYPQGVVRAFLDGLLPEGQARRAISRDVGVREDDTFGLIGALGRDCAGALVIQPTHEPDPPHPTTTTAEPLTDGDLAELVANLRNAPLGVGGRVRISLAGIQAKLLLTRTPDGRWGRPVDGTPSTHILKPEIAGFPCSVENEAFSMRIAKHLGLRVANVETMIIGDCKLIVIERYDRVVQSGGSVSRLHQEDFCQATGIPPDRKYEEDGGPSLRQIANIIQAAAAVDSIETLLRLLTLNVAIGNGDAHAKNFSLLRDTSGGLRLAPAYDLMSTLFYGDDRLAMYVDDVRLTKHVTASRIIKEGTSWGMSRTKAAQIVGQLLDGFESAMQRAARETPGIPAELVDIVSGQLDRLLAE